VWERCTTVRGVTASRITLRDRVLELRPGRPLVMGIVNANPDSFSDAVRHATLDAQVAHALRLVQDGADVIDVGGESGVTYTGVTPGEVERDRVVPLVRRLVGEGVVVSVDTWKPIVAAAALDAGAHVLNDVSGLRDPALAGEVARTGASLVVMHTRAAPKVEHFADYGGDVVGDVVAFLRERCALAVQRGVAEDRLIVDPGPDFAKSPAESVAALRAIDRVRALGLPWLAAVSRKYFLAAITGRPPADRLAATLAAVGYAADHGAAMVRVHDVAATVDYLAVREVLHGGAEVGDVDPDDDGLKWIREGQDAGGRPSYPPSAPAT
jgi:dihydropteroate synthase